MRQFTPKEKEMIEKIIHLKNKGELGELQFGKLIKDYLGAIAIKWAIGDKPSISVYVLSDNNSQTYFDIADYLYFIDELAQNRLIEIDYYSLKADEKRLLYDRTLYTIELPPKYKRFMPNSDELVFYRKSEINGRIVYSRSKTVSVQYNVELAELFEKYANAIIYPLPVLAAFSENGYITTEQRNFNTQMWWTIASVIIASISVIVSIVAPFCSPDTKVDNNQLETIENAIKSTKSEFPNQIDVSLPDTITVKDIDQKPIINNIYNNIPQNNAQK